MSLAATLAASRLGGRSTRALGVTTQVTTKRGSGRWAFLLAAIFALASVLFLLWLVSSSSLAFADCKGSYSLSAELARCRRSALLALLLGGSVILSLAFIVIGLAQRVRSRRGTQAP